MKLLFEVGDKIYKKDYEEAVFLDMQNMAIKYCSENDLSIGEGHDDEGEYIEIFCRDGEKSEHNIEIAQINKLNDLKYCKEEIEFSPIDYAGFSFNVTELDLLRLQLLISTLSENEKIDYFDADGFKHKEFSINDFKAIIKAYTKRLLELETVMANLKGQVMSAVSVKEVISVSTDDFFLI